MSDAPAGLQNSAAVGVGYVAPGEEPEPEPQKSTAAGSPTPSGPQPYNPGEHTVADVLDYLSAHPEQHDAVMAAEKSGKARTSIVGD